MKNTIRRFVAAIMAASMLTLTANAYTVPDYDFDYSEYQPKSNVGCPTGCDVFNYQEESEEYPYHPNCIMICVKCTYSVINMEFTLEDFPEIQDYAYMIEDFENLSYKKYTTEETISDYLSSIPRFHHFFFVNIKEEYQTVENAILLRDTVVEACDSGSHPELCSVEINTSGSYDDAQSGDGDVNSDGKTNAMDATLVARYAVGTVSLDNDAWFRADVNADLDVNALDATLIARYAVGAIDKYGNAVA